MAQLYGDARTKWFPGVVATVHESAHGAEEAYDIDFDDGDEEKRLPRRFIRLLTSR